MAYKISVPPATEPVTLTELKTHLNITGTDHDTYLTDLIEVSRTAVEDYIRGPIMTQTAIESWDEFPCYNADIELTLFPVQSITTFSYVKSEDGTTGTLVEGTGFSKDVGSNPARIEPFYNTTWPATRAVNNALSITYVAGYASAALVPAAIKQAILLMAADLFCNRDDAVRHLPRASQLLLNPYKKWLVGV